MKKKSLLLYFLILTMIFLASCGKKSEYYIDELKSQSAANNQNTAVLSAEQIKIIEDSLPETIKWYNSVDISEPLPLDFVAEDVTEAGNNFSSIFAMYDYGSAEYTAILPIFSVYGNVAKIMMTSEIEYSLTNDGGGNITVKPEDWKSLGESIKEAKSFYFDE